VKTVEESAGICGFDAHKWVKGCKRHILEDTLGLLLAVYVSPTDLHDGKGARCLLAGLVPLFPRLKKIWADAAYRGRELAAWCQAEGGWDLEVVERQPDTRGFSIQPRRWLVERTFAYSPTSGGWLAIMKDSPPVPRSFSMWPRSGSCFRGCLLSVTKSCS